MLRENNKVIRHAMTAADLGATVIAFYLAYLLRSKVGDVQLRPFSDHIFFLYLIVPVWLFFLFYYGCYQSIRLKGILQIILPVSKTVLSGGFVIMAFFFIFKLQHMSRAFIMVFLFFDLLLLASIRLGLYLLSHYVRKRGYNYRSILIVGSGKRADAFARRLDEHKEWGIRVIGFVDYEETASRRVNNNRIIGSYSQLQERGGPGCLDRLAA